MAYRAELEAGRTLTLEQQDQQTLIRVEGGGQSQSAGFQTGAWRQPPRLFRTDAGLLIEIRADPVVYYRLEGDQLHSLDTAPALEGARETGLHEAPDGETKPMKGLEPMKPMKPMKPM